jgi:hypothetical protein
VETKTELQDLSEPVLSIADKFKKMWANKQSDKDALNNLLKGLSGNEEAELVKSISNDSNDENLHELIGYLLKNIEDVDNFLKKSTFTKELLILEAKRAGFAKDSANQLSLDESLLENLYIPPFLIDHSINFLPKLKAFLKLDLNNTDNKKFKKEFFYLFPFKVMEPIIISQLNKLPFNESITLPQKLMPSIDNEPSQNHNRIYDLLTLTENNLTADESTEGFKKFIEFKFTQLENELNAVSQLSITRKHKQNLNSLKKSLLEEINDKQYDDSKKPKITGAIKQTEHLVSEYKKTIMELTNINDKSIRKQKIESFILKTKEYENNLIEYSLGQEFFIRACTFVGGLIGAVIGLAAGIIVGGVVGGTIGSVFPGIGTVTGIIAGSIGSVVFAIKGAGLGAATGEAAASFILGLPSSLGVFKGCQKVRLFFNAHQRCTKDLSQELRNSMNENLSRPQPT